MRGAQNATLASLNHDRFTAPEVGEWLNILGEAKLDAFHQASLRNLKRQRDREVRIPKELVLASAKASTDGFTRWMAARDAEDFSLFAPALETLVELSKAKIACLKKDEACGYDILLEQFDPGVTSAWLEPVFDRMAKGINDILDEIRDQKPPAELEGTWSIE